VCAADTWGHSHLNYFFYLFELPHVCKIQNQPFLTSTIHQSFQGGSLNHNEQLSLWEDDQNPNQI
jgi:hypothetical protein